MKTKSQSGFTIIELMLTIAVAGALLAVGVPAFNEMVRNNCLTSKTNALIGAMQLARSTAITVRDEVRVGPMCHLDENDTDTEGTCVDADEFGDGVVIFRDLDGDGFADPKLEDVNENGVLDGGEDLNGNGQLDYEVLRIIEFSCAATIDETANQRGFRYGSDGTSFPAGTTSIMNVCDDRVSSTYKGRRITLNTTGRVASEADITCP